jgi:hypothetical protein
MDNLIKNFYDNVKDPLWPTIQSYIDFVKLPKSIKDECYNVHNFQEVRNQIENGSYWAQLHVDVFQHQDLVYIPVAKCASTYYRQLFKDVLGWKTVKLNAVDFDSVTAFGLVMHPLTRWVKGMTEWVTSPYYPADDDWRDRTKPHSKVQVDYDQFSADLQRSSTQHMLRSVTLTDRHTLPYSVTFNKNLHRINWLPMDYFSSDNEIKISLMKFFKAAGHNITLPLDSNRSWDSSEEKLQILNVVSKEFASNPVRQDHLYSLYSEDLKFFHSLLDKFDPDWQQLQTSTPN